MKHRAGLTAQGKKIAILRCRDIEAALHSLLSDVLNGKAYCTDIDKVLALLRAMQQQRYRFEDYPELAAENDEARIRELIDEGYPPKVARALAKDEQASVRRNKP